MKTYRNGLRRIWYDWHLRMWTMQRVDRSGNQVGEVEYDFNRKRAFDWLNYETEQDAKNLEKVLGV